MQRKQSLRTNKGKKMKSADWLLLCSLFSIFVFAEEAKKELTFGGFIDSYYAFDFNEPGGDRAYTTQALRHNEFNINLAYLEAKLQREKVHGRLALQAGTSVYSNYAGESRYGTGSQLADVMRHVQEAYGGYQVANNLWLDAGIFFSHIGNEGFISKDNWNYTRSLGADYSPYYQAGVRATYQFNPEWSAQLHVLNGWQNIIENNSDKSVGMQLSYAPSQSFSITYNNLIGRESEFRFFNDLILKFQVSKALSLCLTSDYGMQKKVGTSDYSNWLSETLTAKLTLSPTVSLSGRVEYFDDKDQVLAVTSTPNGFQTFGASLNLDWEPEPGILFRNEVRSLSSKDAIFNGKNGSSNSNTLIVTSIALTF